MNSLTIINEVKTMKKPLQSDNVYSKMEAGAADTIIYTKGGLKNRLSDVNENKSPRDFYYGFLGLLDKGYDLRMLSISDDYPGVIGKLKQLKEKVWSRTTGISSRKNVLKVDKKYWTDSKNIISFTDHFSLALGDYFNKVNKAPHTIGLFHGLCHFENRLTYLGKMISDSYIRNALNGLDYIGFFGPIDREVAISRYNLDKNKTGIFRFGVDAEFWRNLSLSDTKEGFNILSVGSDPSRDYETLVQTDIQDRINIITSLSVDVPSQKSNIFHNRGDFYCGGLSDLALRNMYNKADVIVVPLHDVFQPSGYSVTLQAMACEKPVILSNIKGLWTPELLVDEENCLLVEPGNPAAITEAVHKLKSDRKLYNYIAGNGRKLVEEHFVLKNMEESLMGLLKH